ncbi:YhbY family RNA-binding protein [Candidatus Woesearchaeota archaeon]|nr:YhbY family RNA-binding protein [Candidatus Woesearchaeota archaeon]
MPSLKELKSKALELKPVIWVGKSGLTDNVIKEIKTLLKKKKLIKVKFLKGIIKEKGRKELVKELAEKTDSRIIHQVGFVVVLYKK